MQLTLSIASEADAKRAVNLLQIYLGAGTPVVETAPAPVAAPETAPIVEATVAPPSVVTPVTPETAPAPVAANGDVEVDGKDTPWLEEVHAGTKTKRHSLTICSGNHHCPAHFFA